MEQNDKIKLTAEFFLIPMIGIIVSALLLYFSFEVNKEIDASRILLILSIFIGVGLMSNARARVSYTPTELFVRLAGKSEKTIPITNIRSIRFDISPKNTDFIFPYTEIVFLSETNATETIKFGTKLDPKARSVFLDYVKKINPEIQIGGNV